MASTKLDERRPVATQQLRETGESQLKSEAEVGLIGQFRPPALLGDFDGVPGLGDQWSQAISDWLDAALEVQRQAFREQDVLDAQVQFFNPMKLALTGKILQQAVVWNAFPKELVRKHGSQGALEVADQLLPFSASVGPLQRLPGSFRQGSEYCEWRVFRDSANEPIRKIVFTSEPPEYWRAMFGGSIEYSPDTHQSSTFTGDRNAVLGLYHKLVSPQVELDDLRAPDDIPGGGLFPDIKKNEYNPFNKWNTTCGIVHLTHPDNSLLAEINLAAAATILRKDSRGRVLVEPEELICCAGFGNPNRNSDPTIGATVNALARLGTRISLADPVGLYMDHIDLAGWTAPNGEDVRKFVEITRGEEGMITRLEIKVPDDRGFMVGHLKIGGVPISYGGQVAACVTVKLAAIATEPNSVQDLTVLRCAKRCFVTDNEPLELQVGTEVPPNGRPVFVREGEEEPFSQAGTREAGYRDQLGEPRRLRHKQAGNGN